MIGLWNVTDEGEVPLLGMDDCYSIWTTLSIMHVIGPRLTDKSAIGKR